MSGDASGTEPLLLEDHVEASGGNPNRTPPEVLSRENSVVVCPFTSSTRPRCGSRFFTANYTFACTCHGGLPTSSVARPGSCPCPGRTTATPSTRSGDTRDRPGRAVRRSSRTGSRRAGRPIASLFNSVAALYPLQLPGLLIQDHKGARPLRRSDQEALLDEIPAGCSLRGARIHIREDILSVGLQPTEPEAS